MEPVQNEFNEEDHPRAEDGKFTGGGGGDGGSGATKTGTGKNTNIKVGDQKIEVSVSSEMDFAFATDDDMVQSVKEHMDRHEPSMRARIRSIEIKPMEFRKDSMGRSYISAGQWDGATGKLSIYGGSNVWGTDIIDHEVGHAGYENAYRDNGNRKLIDNFKGAVEGSNRGVSDYAQSYVGSKDHAHETFADLYQMEMNNKTKYEKTKQRAPEIVAAYERIRRRK
jgi:hypothetical protein